MNEYELNCLIEGEDDTLIVSVSSAAKIKELKQVIYREGELKALQYRLLDLMLWKVGQDFYIINAVHRLSDTLA